VIGLSVGLALIGLLILLPRARQGSFYEVGDPRSWWVFRSSSWGLPLERCWVWGPGPTTRWRP